MNSRVVVITGAGSGIGAALAQIYAESGAELALADVHAERLQQVVEALPRGTHVLTHAFDVADEAAWGVFSQRVRAELGGAHVVINNAGVALADTVSHMSTTDAQWLMGVNFWGVFHGSRVFLPQMLAKPCSDKPCIVNISSVFAFVSMPTQSVYNASKAAVRAFSDSLREELRPSGINVLCVHPGGIRTRIAQDARTGDLAGLAIDPHAFAAQFERGARNTPQTAAKMIFNAERRGKTRLLIGFDAKLGDWIHRLFPARSSKWFSSLISAVSRRLSK